MPTQLPIACSLDATEFPRRLAEMADVGRAVLTIDAPDGAGPILTELVDAFRSHRQVAS